MKFKFNRNIKHIFVVVSTGVILSISCISKTSNISENISTGNTFYSEKNSEDQYYEDDLDVPLYQNASITLFGLNSRGLLEKQTVSDWLMENGIMYSHSSIADKYQAADIDSFIKIYQNSSAYRWSILKGLKKAIELSSFTIPVFNEEGIPVDFILLPIIESSYNPAVFSRKGAAGLWQFMPGTALSFGLSIEPHVDERRDPYKSARAAALYLKRLYMKFGDWSLVVAAYNVGEYKVQKLLERYRETHKDDAILTFWQIKSELPQETQDYVPRFFAIVKIMHNPQFYGFTEFDTMQVKVVSLKVCKIYGNAGLDVSQLADMAGLSLKAFMKYNPQFTADVLPINDTIVFYLPENSYSLFIENFAELAANDEKDISPHDRSDTENVETWEIPSTTHRVQPGETLEDIANTYGISTRKLKSLNGLTSENIYPGQILIIPEEQTVAK